MKRNPKNGWALYGLMQALRAQGKDEDAKVVEQRFEKAWARADVVLSTSRILSQPLQVTAGSQQEGRSRPESPQ